jgi:hypothetical protein
MTESADNPTIDAPDYGPGLRAIRKRRWCLWAEILIYLPAMMITMKISPTYRALAVVFAAWFIMLWVVVGYSALARCPRCGNYFHMHGMTLLYFRKCLHCQLHLKADKVKYPASLKS